MHVNLEPPNLLFGSGVLLTTILLLTLFKEEKKLIPDQIIKGT